MKMKSRTKWFVLAEIILAIMALACILFMIREKSTKKQNEIAVIIQNSGDEQWGAFRYGLEMAAQDMDAKVFVVSTGENLSAEDIIELMNQEISDGIDGIILQPTEDEDFGSLINEANHKVPIMLIGKPNETDKELARLPVVSPDDYMLGEELANEIIRDYNGKLAGKKIGIYSGQSGLAELIERENGFVNTLQGTGVIINWRVSEEGDEDILQCQSKVDVVAALDTEGVVNAGGYAKENNLHGAIVYGIGNSMRSIYYLDAGAVKSLIVPDEFSLGYYSLMELANKLEHGFAKMNTISISHTNIRKETLFTEANQKLLFTMNH